ncbi:uncharacterized protein LOC130810820 [Amaranthus tricolor]|uniref:uncharacterized protein LOC130810820 n=1 Tax=Amaranthus tricolor TaxID=29722 RepID=UPI00258E7C4B|nr:uncharacterized protein LOC130810820 [Amaranthus tricolor]
MSSNSSSPCSKKSKAKGRQPDLRELLFKRMISQQTSNEGNESSPLSSPLSPPLSSPPSEDVNMEVGGSSSCDEPLDDEWVYDVELLPHDPGLRKNIMDYPPNERNPRLEKHVGGIKSAHNIAYEKYVNLRDAKKTSIEFVFDNASEVQMNEYHIRLNASLTCLRFLLGQGLAFPGHDESEESYSRGNFLELLKWLGGKVEEIRKYTFQNAPKNCQLTSPKIQKDIITCCAKETTKRIIEEVGDGYFSILADESSDVSQKEQLALILRFVNRENGSVVERFLGILHVGDTTALSLKNAIMSLLMEHSLSPSMIRGQGYDGASNMRGEINGLKTLIMNDTPRAYYIHCFAHQLQLTLVAVAIKNVNCTWIFDVLANLLNVVGASCKRRDLIRKNQAQVVAQALEVGEIESGSGLNQERRLSRPGDTRWGSHYKCLISIINLFPSIVKVLEEIGENGSPDDKLKAQMRDQGWDSLLDKVILFFTKHEIDVPSMDAQYVPQGRSRRFAKQATNLHHFRVAIFLEVIDLHLQEIDNHFNEKNMELLTCMASLSPRGNFSSFDKERILKLASLYPEEFSCYDLTALDLQLNVFLDSMQNDERFHDLQNINSLSMMLVPNL